jgi:SOS-response transcriptional repressor LexA
MTIDRSKFVIFPMLTITQKKLLSYIMWYYLNKHHRPSYKEMSNALKIKGNPSAKLKALEKKGYISRNNSIGGIEMTQLSFDYLDMIDLKKWEEQNNKE